MATRSRGSSRGRSSIRSAAATGSRRRPRRSPEPVPKPRSPRRRRPPPEAARPALFAPRRAFTLRSRGRSLALGRETLVMGVVNVTPDSFSDGGRFADPRRAVEEAFRQTRGGAAIVDVGGESTRPGAEPVAEGTEIERVLPVIEALRAAECPAWISVDTTKVAVARAALEAGADMINDISGLRFEPGLAALAARHGVPLVLMHSRGRPQTMQKAPRYDDLLGEVAAELRAGIETAAAHGLAAESVVIDPGIGFAKTAGHNHALLVRLSELAAIGRPMLVGTSRKSFIGRILDAPPDERLEGTIATVVLAAAGGAHIVRVHDVAACRRALLVTDVLRAEWEKFERA